MKFLAVCSDDIWERRSIVEHVFGTIKDWMGRDHFRTRRLANVRTEMNLYVLAYNVWPAPSASRDRESV